MIEYNQKIKFEYWQAFLDEIWIEAMKSIHPGKDITQAAKEAFGYLLSDPQRLIVTTPQEYKRLVNGWLSNQRPFKKKQQTKGADLTNL